MQTKTLIKNDNQRILMGNEALGRGIVEAGVTLAASYPGTPASEILASVVSLRPGDRGRALRRVVGEREGGL